MKGYGKVGRRVAAGLLAGGLSAALACSLVLVNDGEAPVRQASVVAQETNRVSAGEAAEILTDEYSSFDVVGEGGQPAATDEDVQPANVSADGSSETVTGADQAGAKAGGENDGTDASAKADVADAKSETAGVKSDAADTKDDGATDGTDVSGKADADKAQSDGDIADKAQADRYPAPDPDDVEDVLSEVFSDAFTEDVDMQLITNFLKYGSTGSYVRIAQKHLKAE